MCKWLLHCHSYYNTFLDHMINQRRNSLGVNSVHLLNITKLYAVLRWWMDVPLYLDPKYLNIYFTPPWFFFLSNHQIPVSVVENAWYIQTFLKRISILFIFGPTVLRILQWWCVTAIIQKHLFYVKGALCVLEWKQILLA